MSVTQTTPTPSTPGRRSSLTRWAAGGSLGAVALSSQASDLCAQGPEVHRAFWEGVDDGLANG